ncbi:hypothetical protein JCM6882_004659 [Rhodosporidiobolus microsporus]
MPSLSDLPPEVLDHVLFFLLPVVSFSTLPTRLEILRGLALVSKTFRRITRRELFRVVSLVDDEQAVRFLETARANKAVDYVQNLYIDCTCASDDGAFLYDILEACRRVRRLRVTSDDFDLAALDGLRDLRVLDLDSTIATLSRPITLPSLVEFSSSYSVAYDEYQTAFFTPASLPSLRIVALRHGPEDSPAFPSTDLAIADYFFPSAAIRPHLDLVSHNDIHLLSLIPPTAVTIFCVTFQDPDNPFPALSQALSTSPFAIRLLEQYPDLPRTNQHYELPAIRRQLVDFILNVLPPSPERILPILILPPLLPEEINPVPSMNNPPSYPGQVVYADEDALVFPHFRRWADAHRAAKELQ